MMLKIQKKNLQELEDNGNLELRWIAEIILSCIKGIFGKNVTSIRLEKYNKVMVLKISL